MKNKAKKVISKAMREMVEEGVTGFMNSPSGLFILYYIYIYIKD